MSTITLQESAPAASHATTSSAFLESLRNELGESWYRLNEIYVPMIRGWLCHLGLQPNEADDVAQEVLVVVLRKLHGFKRQRVGSFRNWLRQITVNCLRDHRRWQRRNGLARNGEEANRLLDQFADPDSSLTRRWNLEHDRHVLEFTMQEAQQQFSVQTWEAFRRTAYFGESVRDVANRLGMSENAVAIAKSRVQIRLRRSAKGLLD